MASFPKWATYFGSALLSQRVDLGKCGKCPVRRAAKCSPRKFPEYLNRYLDGYENEKILTLKRFSRD